MPSSQFFQRLKERKLVQWALAYVAGAFVVFQLLDALAEPLGLSTTTQQAVLVIVAIGFLIALVLAWYHGEKGRQRVSGPELLMVAALLVVAGVALSLLGRGGQPETIANAPVVVDDDSRPSVAVLPFDNFSPDPDDAWFADGMQEEITSTLAKVRGLRVTGRTSVMQYRTEKPPIPAIADALKVGFIVEGSAQLVRDRVRLTVQLVDAVRDEHVWSDEYDLALTAEDLFSVKSGIARRVAFEIGVNLTPEERDDVARVLTDNTEAYLLYLQGNERFARERAGQWSSASFASMSLYEQAMALDPELAVAHAGLALSLTYTTRDEERLERARRESELALSLHPGLAEARVALGRHALRVGQAEDAMRHFRVARTESPNMVLAHLELGKLQRMLGDFDGGLATLLGAEALDPRNPAIQIEIVGSLRFAHRFDDALAHEEIWKAAVGMDASYNEVLLLLSRGDLAGARTAMTRLIDIDPSVFYRVFGGGPSYTVPRRALSQSERNTAFDAFLRRLDQPCHIAVDACRRRATHEQEVGSRAAARILWDSLAATLPPGEPQTRSLARLAALVYKGLGEKEAAIRAAEALVGLDGAAFRGGVENQFSARRTGRLTLAQILAHFDEHDRAIDILEEELPAPSWLTVHLLEIDPYWDPLREHPRFQALLEKYADDVEH